MTEILEGEIIEHGTDLVPAVPASLPISFVDNPAEFLEEAATQAKVLKDFLVKTNSVVKIGPSEHVKVGGWQFLAQLAGLSVGTTAEPITLDDGDTGWKAHAVVYRAGQQVGPTGEALCLRSERNWKNSDTYAICSMAQTRAISKAIKGVLGFVVVMAGYSDTPAEEMPRPERKSKKEPTAADYRKRIRERAVEADTRRGETKTADEIETVFKNNWDTSLDKASQEQLEIVGKELRQWLDAGCSGPFELVPF